MSSPNQNQKENVEPQAESSVSATAASAPITATHPQGLGAFFANLAGVYDTESKETIVDAQSKFIGILLREKSIKGDNEFVRGLRGLRVLSVSVGVVVEGGEGECCEE